MASFRRNRNNKPTTGRTVGLIAVGVLALGGIVTAGVLAPKVVSTSSTVVAAIIYQTSDDETTAYSMPAEVKHDLAQYAADGDSVLVVRIDGDCKVTTNTVDLTPRTSSGEVLNVPSKIDAAIAQKIADLETDTNTPTPGTTSRCIYVGLLSARIPHNIPVYLFTNGIDLTAPVDFRDLAWQTTPEQLIKVVNDAKVVPDLKGTDVELVLAAPTGDQGMRATETEYLHTIWSALLTNAGATSVSFVDGMPGDAASTDRTPVVPLPGLPTTPIAPVPDPKEPEVYSCTLDGATAYFVVNTPRFIDAGAVKAALADCVSRISPGSTIDIESWVSYEGPLDANGNPTNPRDPADVELSSARSAATRDLMISMGVDPSMFTSVVGNAATNLPHPEAPRSPLNRVSIITVHPPTK